MINDNEVDGFGFGQAPRPITTNIEEVYIEALEYVVLDATRMENVEQYWANFGRGHMTFDNVSLQGDNLSITKDVTFGIRDTQFDTNFTAKFDSQSLIREATSQVNSSLLVRIADVSTETPSTPLANVDLNLSFDLGGETVTLENVQSTDGTYPGLALALRNALEEAGYDDVNVNLSTPYDTVTVAGNTVTLPFTAQEILLTDPAGNAFSNVNFTQAAIEPVADGFLVAGNAQPQDPSSTSSLIESNLVLDNAGRGSIAGDVVIGGGSNSDLGVEQFNVRVNRSSEIESLTTTNDKLQNIVISSIGAAGSLYIGKTQADLAEIDANDFEGAELSLGEVVNTSNGGTVGEAIEDLTLLNASSTSADVTFNGVNDGGTVAVLNTGAGDDTITLNQTGESSPSDASQTRSTINAGNGDNTVTVSGENTSTIITGTGADTITGNAVSITVESGAGNDVIYAENTGTAAESQLDAGVFNTVASTQVSNNSTFNNVQLLAGRQVQVTLALPEDAVAVDAFANGLEVIAEVEASDGDLTTERDLYEAVANAINNDSVLSKLATASVDSAGNLSVDYLIDGNAGVTVSDSVVQIEVLGTWADLTTAQQNNYVEALQAEYGDSDIDAADVEIGYNAAAVTVTADTDVAGTDATSTGVNTINAGAGDDVVVLSSNDSTIDTVEFDAGNFGNDTIVHFQDGPLGDVLDFSDWLNNVVSESGSAESEQRVATSFDGTTLTTVENSVTVADFTGIAGLSGETFAEMSDADVLSALNANFTAGTADVDLVGDIQKSILMIQNDDGDGNLGEYKVYEVSYDTDEGEYVSASLAGSVDFGSEQSFELANFA